MANSKMNQNGSKAKNNGRKIYEKYYNDEAPERTKSPGVSLGPKLRPKPSMGPVLIVTKIEKFFGMKI